MLFAHTNAALLHRKLGGIIRKLPDGARKADAKTAEDVASKARSRAMAKGSVQRHVSPGIGIVRPGFIELDGNAQPAIYGAEHGSVRFPQFPASKGKHDGYMLQPELRDGKVVDRYAEALDDEMGF